MKDKKQSATAENILIHMIIDYHIVSDVSMENYDNY